MSPALVFSPGSLAACLAASLWMVGCGNSNGSQPAQADSAASGDSQADPDTQPEPDLSDWNRAAPDSEAFELFWRPVDGSIPRNQEFEMDLYLKSEGQPCAEAEIFISGSMPAHGHGMVQQPIVTAKGRGHYRVEGMLLHMRGDWVLLFEVTLAGQTGTVQFELEL